MRKIVVTEHVSLDGVMQSPSSPEEDPSGGFEHGGWHVPYVDDDFMRIVGENSAQSSDYLFGRRTYEIMASHWPHVPEGDMFGDILNSADKYVASTTLEDPLAWRNATLLKGDVADAVAALKAASGNDIVVLGSRELVRTLMRHDLIDEYLLMIDPLLLGGGKRLFEDSGRKVPLALDDVKTTGSGVILARYRRP